MWIQPPIAHGDRREDAGMNLALHPYHPPDSIQRGLHTANHTPDPRLETKFLLPNPNTFTSSYLS